MTKQGGIAGEQLRQYIEKIERLEEEKAGIAGDIREAYAEAKANGFEPKIMRQVIRLRKLDKPEFDEMEFLLDSYKVALGMATSYEETEEPGESNSKKLKVA